MPIIQRKKIPRGNLFSANAVARFVLGPGFLHYSLKNENGSKKIPEFAFIYEHPNIY
jgi:hypothetical protein